MSEGATQDEYQGSTFAALMATDKPKEQSPSKPTKSGTMVPSHQHTNHGTNIETIRASLKQSNEKSTNYRLSETEKEMLVDVVYSFKKQGLRTSENEIMRVALNSLLLDYNERAEASILAQVLESLNA